MIQPYLSTWPQAMAIQASPGNAVESLKNLSRLVDDIWFFAGDRSIDVRSFCPLFVGICFHSFVRLSLMVTVFMLRSCAVSQVH